MTVLLFGPTGAAGGSVLKACLVATAVTEVRAVSRRALPASDPKLRVIIHGDFLDYAAIAEAFAGVDACLFCLGISVTQVSGEPAYRQITHDFAMAAARMTKARSPQAAFHYISGRGTRLDSRFMWARVKAESERDLIAEVGAVCWRPGFIDGETSASGPRLYQRLRPLGRLFAPFTSLYVAGEDIGRAMLQTTTEGVRGRIIENAEIRAIARRAGPQISGPEKRS
jgi:uncharacterized protein YbjT (DUF2867 family)